MALALVAVPGFGLTLVQDPGPEEEFERLAEASASVESFTARYSVLIDGKEAGSVELAYLAPDTAVIETIMDDGPSSAWYVNGVLTVLNSSAEGAEWGQLDIRATIEGLLQALAPLYEEFPELEVPGSQEPKPLFHVHFEESDEGVPDVGWEISIETAWRSFFCWYYNHRDRWDEMTIEGDHLILHDGNGVLRIARAESAGFLMSAVGPNEQGHLELRLASLEYAFDDSLLQIPDRPQGARDFFGGSDDPRIFAEGAHQQVAQLLAEGRLEWDEDTKRCFGVVLDGIHRQWLSEHYSDWVEERREDILETADLVLRALDEGVDEEMLRGFVLREREKIERVLKTGADACANNQTVVVEGEWGEELLWIEREVVRSLFDETVTQPLLEFFEAEIESLL